MKGPIRSVWRVDGRYANVPGFGFTTRYTFYAGKRTVRIEHVLRNSLQTNERHLKLRSATLTLGAPELATPTGRGRGKPPGG